MFGAPTKRRAQARAATGGMSTLAQTIAIPHEHPPLRMPTFPNLERTGVMPTVNTSTVAVPSGAKRDVLLIRNPVFPAWTLSAASTGTAAIGYQNAAVGVLKTPGDIMNTTTDAFTSPVQSGVDTTWLAAYSRRYPVGVLRDGRQFVKAISGSSGFNYARIGNSDNTFRGSVRFLFEQYDGAETQLGSVDVFAVDAATATEIMVLDVNLGPWFRLLGVTLLTLTAGTVNVVSLSMGIISGGTFTNPTGSGLAFFAPMFEPAEMKNSVVPYSSTRANATALLLSNVTAVLDKEGTIIAARSPRTNGALWQGSLSGSFETTIQSAHPHERYFGPLEKGLYSFTLPDESSSEFRDYVQDFGTPALSRIHLDSFDYANLIVLADLGGNGTTIAVTQDAHLEFRTNSMLFPLGYSTVPLEAYHIAQMALVRQGVFYENPVHLAAIGTLIRTAVARLTPMVAPYLRTAAVSVGNALLNAGVKQINTKMSQMGLSQPQPPPQRKARKPRAKVVVRAARGRK